MNKATGVILLTLFWFQSVIAQSNFEGFIKDGEGSPVIGATIIIKGTQVHSISDLTGYFSLPVEKEFPVTIRISSVGFESQEIDIYELPQEPTEIILLNNNLMEQVVVTSRRREEVAQNIPVPVSVIGGARAEDAGAFSYIPPIPGIPPLI
jgi:iron complex outermembrane receptor protein